MPLKERRRNFLIVGLVSIILLALVLLAAEAAPILTQPPMSSEIYGINQSWDELIVTWNTNSFYSDIIGIIQFAHMMHDCDKPWKCGDWSPCANGYQTRECTCGCVHDNDCYGDHTTERDCGECEGADQEGVLCDLNNPCAYSYCRDGVCTQEGGPPDGVSCDDAPPKCKVASCAAGQCVYTRTTTPNCGAKVCGVDSCGLSCGTCKPPPWYCAAGKCVCTPDCMGKGTCADDGCGGKCGTCNDPWYCNVAWKCVCEPKCRPDPEWYESNGCGGICGNLPAGSTTYPAPPTDGIHNICSGTTCISVSGGGTDECTTSDNCAASPTHKICSGTTCISVSGGGTDECTSNANCATFPISGIHNICSGTTCVLVSGDGTDECTSDANCAASPTHKGCSGTTCVLVSGDGTDTCTSDANCAAFPTHKGCLGTICALISGGGLDTCTSDANCAAFPTHKGCLGTICALISGGGLDTCTTSDDCAAFPTHKICLGMTCVLVSGDGTDTCTTSDDCAVSLYCTQDADCNDYNACNGIETCNIGTGKCVSGTPMICTALDQCHDVGTCAAGVCSNPPKAAETACDDGNACTQTDTCQAGVCTGSNLVVCTTLDICHTVGTCDTMTGVCSTGLFTCTCLSDADCNDGNACTTDSCNPATGACSNTLIPNCCTPVCTGKNCGDDDTCGGKCTVQTCSSGQTCSNGVCIPLSPRPHELGTEPTCSDGIQNGNETGVDCGGSCQPCGLLSMSIVAEPNLQVGEILHITITDELENPVVAGVVVTRPDGTIINPGQVSEASYTVDLPGNWSIHASKEGYKNAEAVSTVGGAPPAPDLATQITQALQSVVTFITKEPVTFALLLCTVFGLVGFFIYWKRRGKKGEIEKL